MSRRFNYELIYKMRREDTSSLRSLQVRAEQKALREAQETHQKYLKALKRELGHERFAVSDWACVADGISVHVWSWPEGPEPSPGLGKRVCVYCGCDDFDD